MMRVKSIIISGFTDKDNALGGYRGWAWYEWCCQCMLFDGVEFIEKNKLPSNIWEEGGSLRGKDRDGNVIDFYGVFIAPKALEPLEKQWSEKYSPSGAMHQAVCGHLRFIHKKGMANWLAEIEKSRKQQNDADDGVFLEFDLDEIRAALDKHFKESQP